MSSLLSNRLRPILLISTLFGCSVDSKRSKICRFFAAFLFLCLNVFFVQWGMYISTATYSSLYRKAIHLLMVCPVIINGLFTLFTCIITPGFDVALLGSNVQPVKLLTVFAPLLLHTSLIISALVIQVLFSFYQLPLSEFIIFYFSLFIITIHQYQFIDFLKNISQQWDVIISSIHLKKKSFDVLEFTIREAARLTDVATAINDVFSKGIVISLLRSFILLVLSLYCFFIEIQMHLPKQEVKKLFEHGIHFVLVMVTMWYEIWQHLSACESIMYKSEVFTLDLFTLAMEDGIHRICSMEVIKNHFALKRSNCFTAHNFVVLNFKLASAIISSSTTYLVILIQNSPDN
ncbi:uncharacterized protein LOC106672830 [Cimex lectularius]|uniref:Gustatory receptor n=1 Tax=Cimex lectularius TaxID=79782 RepID=A0A8I6SBA8_CIMLE|nr:uncharacterized protein LOC106672830 [Cimex lectularius]